jgi:hypothetical protein
VKETKCCDGKLNESRFGSSLDALFVQRIPRYLKLEGAPGDVIFRLIAFRSAHFSSLQLTSNGLSGVVRSLDVPTVVKVHTIDSTEAT